VEGPGKLLGGLTSPRSFLSVSIWFRCFETAFCFNTIIHFINILAPLRGSYTLAPISD
jgi:hypothetical protein